MHLLLILPSYPFFMRESFSKPFTKQEVQNEIKTGLQDYLRKKLNGVKDEREVIFYNAEQAVNPLTREEVEESINSFIEENFNTIVSTVLNQRGGARI